MTIVVNVEDRPLDQFTKRLNPGRNACLHNRFQYPTEHIYDTQARLRDIGPVVPVQLTGGVTVWAVTTHAAVHQVLADDKIYARNARNWSALHDGSVPADWPFSAIRRG